MAALPQEVAAVEAAFTRDERPQVQIVRGGEGAEAAAAAVQKLLAGPDPPDLICSTGFCGGLRDGLAVGDIILASAIVNDVDERSYSVAFETPGLDALRLALTEARVRHHAGALVSAGAVVKRREEKRKLGIATNALGVDMESYAIARSAGGEAAVFALRVVSDTVDDELPDAVDTFLDEQGRVRVGSVARFALSGVGHTKVLLDMKRNVDKATAALTAAWRAVWRAM